MEAKNKMGKTNECPYCGTMRDEDKICCSNWRAALKIQDCFLPESERPVREKIELEAAIVAPF